MKKGLIVMLVVLLLTNVVVYASEDIINDNIMPTWSGPTGYCRKCGQNAMEGILKNKRKTGHSYQKCIHGYNGSDLVLNFESDYRMVCHKCEYEYDIDGVTSSTIKCKARNK